MAEIIAGAGLEDYYRYRSEPAVRPDAADIDAWKVYDQADLLAQYTRAEADGRRSAVILLENMRCAACAWLIDKTLRRESGILEVNVNAATAHARILWSEKATSFSKILGRIAELGYRPLPISPGAIQQAVQQERRAALKRLAVAGLGMMQVMMFAVALYTGVGDMDATMRQYFRVVSLLVATPVLFYAGAPFFNSAMQALRLRSMNMDVPVSIALALAYGASLWNTAAHRGEVYFDSVTMFIFFLTLGRFIEMALRHRTGSMTEALARLLPRIAHRIHEQRIEEVSVSQLTVGDEVLVRLGETIPADGRITHGATACDEALLTGESLPAKRRVGDAVIAGALNLEAPVHVRVTAIGQDTVLSGIVALIERAQTDKPRLARAADRTAAWFLRRILIGAVLVGVVWLWLDPARAFDAVLAVLVVTCPCALSLATPAAIAAATSALARRGVFVTRADAIETLTRIDRVLFDKTGTLTQGRITVEHCQVLGAVNEPGCTAMAAALEQAAEHPIARAFATAALSMPEDVRIVTGQGVEGRIAGELYRIGTPDFVGALSNAAPPSSPEYSGDIFLGDRHGFLAAFTLGDRVRPDAAAAVAELRAQGIQSEILSGDAADSVARIAAQTGIESYRARLSPKDKLERLHALLATSPHIAVIGDGVNDAPILRAAPVSIAMSGGSALAQANADLILTSSALRAVPGAIAIARRAQSILRQNLTWAAVYNLCALPLAALGWIPPWIAAIGMSASSIVVVFNTMRLLPKERSMDSKDSTNQNPAMCMTTP